LAVIADFQGKPLDHEDVQLEYKEIRDAVLLDVSLRGGIRRNLLMDSEPLGIGHTRLSGDGTELVY
jgi:hypothetical protein